MTELLGAAWRKSSHSGGNGGDCVEVADNLTGVIGLRDSKDPSGPVLTFKPSDWAAFVAAAKDERFAQ